MPKGQYVRRAVQGCRVNGCTSPRWSLGWCIKHYFRVRRCGSPLLRYGQVESVHDRCP